MALAFFLSGQPVISLADQAHHANGEEHPANPLAGAIAYLDADHDHDDENSDTPDADVGHHHIDGTSMAFIGVSNAALILIAPVQEVRCPEAYAFASLAREGPERPPKVLLESQSI